MDGTVRIWDIGALRKMNVGGVTLDVECVFKGDHDSGVNWASFHPSLPLFVSGSNERLVKSWLWEGNLKAEEILRGHMDNVSSVLFHPKRNDIVVSSSEDKSIRVWDVPNQTEILSFCRQHDRFWTLAVHPVINLLAAGHDSGMIVFKLVRERPAFVVSGDLLFYAKDMCLRCYHFSTGQDSKVIPLFGPDTGAASLNQSPRTLSYSPRDEAALIFYGGSYELFMIPCSGFVQEPRRGTGDSSVFIAKSRFALLERSSNQVIVMDLQNKVVKTRSLPMPTNAIFYAGTAVLLCTNEDKACMYDLVRDAVLGELQFPGVRSIVWSTDMESVALLSKHSICIASKMLVSQCVIDEKIPVKSAAWGDHDVLIYTTLRHIKYCLPNGNSATIRPLDFPMYITKVSGNTVFCLDRDGNVIIASRDVEIQEDADAGYELVSGWLFGGMDVEGIFAEGVPVPWYLNYDDHDNAEAVGWGGNRLRGGPQSAAFEDARRGIRDYVVPNHPYRIWR
uniref:Coatomer subunit alpha-2 n=1 Tax=Noccaea caerulescens TaxID=107243 RepID=A0A1J3GEB0_NOCCA